MHDAFATFDLPRRPWLDAAALKDEFHRRSASLHPDAGGEAGRFAQLNAAYQILREPTSRLRQLLELESPATLTSAQAIPPSLAELFMQIGAHRSALDGLWKKDAPASSPLTRALLVPEKMAARANTERLIELVGGHLARALDQLRALDAIWETEKPATRIGELLYAFSFVGKWDAQLRGDLLKLSL